MPASGIRLECDWLGVRAASGRGGVLQDRDLSARQHIDDRIAGRSLRGPRCAVERRLIHGHPEAGRAIAALELACDQCDKAKRSDSCPR